MTDRPTIAPELDAYLARFAWHPEPELVGFRDEGAFCANEITGPSSKNATAARIVLPDCARIGNS